MDEAMPPARTLSAVLLLITLGAIPAFSSRPATAQDKVVQTNPMEVTTDTPEYCLYLLDRVSELVRVASTPVPHQVTDLSTEGHRMCIHGQTRSGIMRLRSALLIMEKGRSEAGR